MKWIARILASALLGLGGPSAIAAPVVILSGDAAGQGPGSVIEDSTIVSVPAGAVLIFNDAAGQTNTITGPFEGPISADHAPPDSGLSTLDRLIASRSAEQSQLGAIRAAPGQAPRDADLISIAQSSVQCLPRDVAARLWRPESLNADSVVELTRTDTGAVARTVWHSDIEQIDWPTEMPLISGARYLIKLEIAPRPVEITIFMAPQTFDSDVDLAAWMGQVGCRRQAFALLDRLAN